MKNRNLKHKDDWMTPPYFYEQLKKSYIFDFDPCPYMHDISKWDGLEVEWGNSNYVNPGYNLKVKTAFVKKAIEESKKGKFCLLLLPVSTSTYLFHDYILPNISHDIIFIKGRIPFIGVNKDGEYVNWHLTSMKAPEGVIHKKAMGQHDSMLIKFGKTCGGKK